jgi:antitoxin component YwqK of YwqJK toxin-antitoxin module
MSFIKKLFNFSNKTKFPNRSSDGSLNKSLSEKPTHTTSNPMMINKLKTNEIPDTDHQKSGTGSGPLIGSLIKSFSPIIKTIKPKSKIKKLIKEDPRIDILETIKLAYKELIDDPDSVYRMCNHHYLVIMQKTPETRTNEARNDVVDPKCAKFRANILNVILIINVLDGKIINTIKITEQGSINGVEMTIGCCIESNRYDNKLSIYSHGIYYYNSIEPAFYRRTVPEKYTGQWIRYHDNGNKSIRANYIDGKKEGVWLHWEEAGYLSHGETYLNDKEHGDWVSWCGDVKICKGVYVDGKRQGIWTYWRYDKTKHSEILYIDDRETRIVKFNRSSRIL